jgi:hypothetical protein
MKAVPFIALAVSLAVLLWGAFLAPASNVLTVIAFVAFAVALASLFAIFQQAVGLINSFLTRPRH